jgi:hypothetical protein
MENQAARRIAALLLGLAAPLAGAEADILNDHDGGPLTGLFGLPDSTESATLVGAGRLRVDTIANTASHSIIDIDGDEALALDGETRRIEANIRFGVSDRLEIGVELPWVWHESGSLDSLIESWHDTFNLPNGARDTLPSDDLRFRYIDGGTDRVNLDQNVSGPGDLRIVAGWQLGEPGDQRYALRAGVKLPTGDS